MEDTLALAELHFDATVKGFEIYFEEIENSVWFMLAKSGN
jgi:hypothetical protein